MKLFYLAPALAVAALAQSDARLTRQGAQWVETTSGSAALDGASQLKVATRGAIQVQGEARGDVSYTLKRLARGRDQQQAHALLSHILVKTRRQGGWTIMEVELPRHYGVSADFQMRVPRGLHELALSSEDGLIEAYDLDGSVRADTRGGAVRLDRIQGDADIRTGGGEVRLGRIGRSLNCASAGGAITADYIGGGAALNTGGGDIFVREAKGRVHATTGGGNIQVKRADAGVTASTGGGLIDVMDSDGPVVAETGNGAINVRSASNIRCQSGTGAIQLHAVYGGLRASTAMGSIMAVLLAGKPLQDSSLTTAMGDITVYIPSNLAVTVQAINDSPGAQRIVSEFPEIRPRLEHGNARSEADGALNGGGPVLRLAASSGTIYLRKQR